MRTGLFRLCLNLIWLLYALCTQGQPADFELPYSPSNRPRMAAEWEPALGALIAWPLSIPKELVVELAKDTRLNVLVENTKGKQDAIKWMTKWGITPDRVRFITAPQGIDVSWTRDWGPHAVFSPEGNMRLADAKYLYATPITGPDCEDELDFIYKDEHGVVEQTKTDDVIPDYISATLDLNIMKLPFAFTGGNVITDGQRSGFSTCVLSSENRYMGISDSAFLYNLRQWTGLDKYHLISNFEDRGIQHIDCYMKMLDEERLLIQRPPADHPSHDIYDGILQHEIKGLKNAYGRPYQILRMDTERFYENELAAYVNSLILNQTVYVPLYGIKQDSVALAQWTSAMPGYTIKGFLFPLDSTKHQPYYRPQVYELYKNIGWTGGDALHCRVRAVWDPNMIYISVNRLPATSLKARSYPITVLLKDYSKGNLLPETLVLKWRIKGEEKWKDIQLTPTEYKDQFSAHIPGNMANVTIDYYVEAQSTSGIKARMPASAPSGYYSTTIN